MAASSSPTLWLNSGGLLDIRDGTAQTIQGDLPPGSYWRQEYRHEGGESQVGSDNGLHPQNLFRLICRQQVTDPIVQFYVRINKVNLSADPERNAWSGVFAMSQYADNGDTLYYAGIRMDGTAVIKKKQVNIPGDHYADALAQVPLQFVNGVYNRTTNPNLLPLHTWIGLRSVVDSLAAGVDRIQLYIDVGRTGHWSIIASAIDRQAGGVPAITAPGFTGIRTDFMDATFQGFEISQT
jgi:hypothetical protein